MHTERNHTYMEDVIDLRQLGAALWHRVWVIVGAVGLAVIGSYVFTKWQTPVYESTTTVLFKDLGSVGEHMFLEGGSGPAPRNRVQNGVQLLRSRQVVERAVRELGLTATPGTSQFGALQNSISIQPVSNTETVRISVQHPDAAFGAELANAVAASFIELSQELNRAEVSAAREFIEEQLAIAEGELHKAEEALQAHREAGGVTGLTEETTALLSRHVELETRRFEIETALADARRRDAADDVAAHSLRLDTVRQQLDVSEQRMAELPGKEIALARLTREQAVLEQSFLLLRRRYEDARIAEAMRSPDVAVIDSALPARTPMSPRPLLNLALGTFLGLFIGLGGALLLEFFDTTLKSPDEVEAALGLPVLGRIPLDKTPGGR